MEKPLKSIQFILYVLDQSKSSSFYSALFRKPPDLHVPGMTEFVLSDTCKLGLMPCHGISKILKNHTPNPANGTGIPRCELYFYVEDIEFEFENALTCGASMISEIEDRDWGDRVCYFSDPDGHIIAFASPLNKPSIAIQ